MNLTDVDSLVEYAGCYEVAEMMNGSIPYPYTRSMAMPWIEKHCHDSQYSKAISWAIVKADNLVGCVQLRMDEMRKSAP